MAQSWKDYIWKQHRLVSILRFDSDVELLDVIVKEGSHGIPIPGFDRGPVLVRIGRIFDLGAPPPSAYHDAASDLEDDSDSDSDSDSAGGINVATLQKELGLLRSRGASFAVAPQLKYLHQAHHGDWRVHLKSSSAFRAAICGLAKASIRGEHAESCSIQNIQSEAVNVDALAKLLTTHTGSRSGAPGGGWVPNIAAIRQRRKPGSSQDLELWIVTKIVYARKIVVGKTGMQSAGITVPLPGAGGPGLAVEGQTESVDFVGVVAGTGLESAPGIPIGYQAMRVKYPADGGVLLRMEMGDSRPVHRTGAEDEALVDLHKESDYHMGELMDAALDPHPLISWQSYASEMEQQPLGQAA